MSAPLPAFRRNLRDAALIQAIALPNAASTTVVTGVLDTGIRSVRAVPPPNIEAVIRVPALTATILPDTKTMTVTIEHSADPAFGSGVETLRTLVITGAGGAGAISAELREVLPPDCARYIRGKLVSGANVTDGSALSADISLITSGS